MIDHAPYIIAKRQAEKENRIIEEMAVYAAPLHWMLLIVLAIFVASQLWDGWHQYADLAAANEVLVQCLNSQSVGIADVLIKCEVRPLTATLSQGVGEVKP